MIFFPVYSLNSPRTENSVYICKRLRQIDSYISYSSTVLMLVSMVVGILFTVMYENKIIYH